MDTIMGYKRADGRFGIRNYVIAISLVQCSNSATVKIASACDIPYITIDTGCGQFKDDADRSNLGMICAGIHPNVYGVLLLSLGCQWTDASYIAKEIEKAGKKVYHLCIQKDGGYKVTIEKGIKIVEDMKAEAASQKKEECPVSGLVISTYPGGSDWTSTLSCNPVLGETADILVKEKGGSKITSCGVRGTPGCERNIVDYAKDYEVGCEILSIVEEYRHDVFKMTGQTIQEVNPTPGNKAGGITTLCEKAIGNTRLQGTAPIQGVLKIGDKVPYPGSWFVDNRMGGNDVYATTSDAMSGAHIILFSTGRGTNLGNAVATVIKITGNPNTYEKMNEFIDYSGGPVLMGEKTVKEAGRELYDLMIEVANGKQTKAEIIGDYSYVTPPFGKI